MSRFAFLPRERILDLVLPRQKLPKTTNIPLVGAFCRTLNASSPTLVVTAQGKLHEVFFDRITGVVLKGARRPNLTHLRVAGTNHTFSTGCYRRGVEPRRGLGHPDVPYGGARPRRIDRGMMGWGRVRRTRSLVNV